MTDVASVMARLLQAPGLRRAAERAARRSLTETDIARLCVLAYLHDIGKANAGFQVRYWESAADRPAAWTVAACGHGPQGWSLLTSVSQQSILATLPVERLNEWGDAVLDLLHASISHHGRPVTADTANAPWNPIQVGSQIIYDPAATVAQIGFAIQDQYPAAFSGNLEPLPDTSEFVHLFAGLVQLADWLGSDTRPGFFPFSEPGEVRAQTAPARALHAVQAVGLLPGTPEDRCAVTPHDFAAVFSVPAPRPIQLAAAQVSGQLVVLEAETGSGKTEAALWRFLQLWRTGQVDALYFALPTRVAATQLYQRVKHFVAQAWIADVPMAVRALAGDAAADGQTFAVLPGFQVLWHDEPLDTDAERRWAAESPKRFLAAPIAVGTIDQALLAALQVKHAHMRHALLARSLLVVDEVHASDAYMTRLSEHLLGAHLAVGGHALLLSATLGAVARTRYLTLGGTSRTAVPNLMQAQVMPYPALSTNQQPSSLKAVTGNSIQKTVHWQVLDAMDDAERVAQIALDAAAQGARVLVVRNTVGEAVATLRAIEAQAHERELDAVLFYVEVAGNAPVSTLHHSRFAKADRHLLDEQVQVQLGKQRLQTGGRIVVGTQTLEQSLDLDADLLITDLCPMDVLLQRVGRLHRHERPSSTAPDDVRPVGFEHARAWVLTPPDHDLRPLLVRQRNGLGPIRPRNQPMGGVYPDVRMLEATRRLIEAEPTRVIPADNRLLVECSTHPEALDAIAQDLGADWVAFGKDCDGAFAASKSVAKLHAVSFDAAFDASPFPLDEAIGTRLGAADRLLQFAEAPMGPFSQVHQLAVRHHLLPLGLAADAQPEAVQPLPDEPGFVFSLGTSGYRYSRFGLERLTTSKEPPHA